MTPSASSGQTRRTPQANEMSVFARHLRLNEFRHRRVFHESHDPQSSTTVGGLTIHG